MGEIALIDTSIYLNILDVTGFNQERDRVLTDFESKIARGDIFLLPFVTVLETGNLIAKLANGGRRREIAGAFVADVSSAFDGEAPYRPLNFPSRWELLAWMSDFPDSAMRSKSPKKDEGVSLADHFIIKEFFATRDRHPMSTVYVWSLDTDLSSFRTA